MKKIIVLSVFLFVMVLGESTRGDEIDDLKRQLIEQNKILMEMQERLEQLEARQRLKEQSLTKKITEVAEKAEQKGAGTLPDSLKWVEKVKISGDFRYRHEHIDRETSSSPTRWRKGRDRHRIRARLMLDAMVNDEWDLGFRLASGERAILASEEDLFADPVSSNQTLKQNFSSKDVWIDLAFFNWHPESMSGLNVYGGKIKNPFYKVGKNQLIWDGDLNPEGVGVTYKTALNDSQELYLNGGGFWMDESSSGVDTSLWGAQAYLKHTMGNPDYVLAGASYWDYGNIQNKTDTYGILAGNAGSGAWASDYDILEVFGEYGTKWNQTPISFFGNWVQNLVASTPGDTGWLLGVKYNKAKDPGSWDVSYSYRELQSDAVLAAFTDSDFGGGGTDAKGHTIGFNYQLAKNLQFGTTYFHNENDGDPDLDYRRLQLDFKLKF
jgi:hypothetical protein